MYTSFNIVNDAMNLPFILCDIILMCKQKIAMWEMPRRKEWRVRLAIAPHLIP